MQFGMQMQMGQVQMQPCPVHGAQTQTQSEDEVTTEEEREAMGTMGMGVSLTGQQQPYHEPVPKSEIKAMFDMAQNMVDARENKYAAFEGAEGRDQPELTVREELEKRMGQAQNPEPMMFVPKNGMMAMATVPKDESGIDPGSLGMGSRVNRVGNVRQAHMINPAKVVSKFGDNDSIKDGNLGEIEEEWTGRNPTEDVQDEYAKIMEERAQATTDGEVEEPAQEQVEQTFTFEPAADPMDGLGQVVNQLQHQFEMLAQGGAPEMVSIIDMLRGAPVVDSDSDDSLEDLLEPSDDPNMLSEESSDSPVQNA